MPGLLESLILAIWIVPALIAARVASDKGRSGVGFFLLTIFLPVIGLIVAFLVSPLRIPDAAPQPVIGVADEVTKLAVLRDAGTITEDEFQRQRAILLPPARIVDWATSAAAAGSLCGRCGKHLSPAWVGKCNHCGAKYTEFPPVRGS